MRAGGQLSYPSCAHWDSELAIVPEEHGNKFGHLQPTLKEHLPKIPHPKSQPQTTDRATAAAGRNGAIAAGTVQGAEPAPPPPPRPGNSAGLLGSAGVKVK